MGSFFFVSKQFIACPQLQLYSEPFSSPTCDIPEIISNKRVLDIPYFTDMTGIKLSYNEMHIIVVGSLAAFVAPFGGFVASGYKRAYKVKDFGKIIPGHGGVIDRLDCIAFMGLLLGIYIS